MHISLKCLEKLLSKISCIYPASNMGVETSRGFLAVTMTTAGSDPRGECEQNTCSSFAEGKTLGQQKSDLCFILISVSLCLKQMNIDIDLLLVLKG